MNVLEDLSIENGQLKQKLAALDELQAYSERIIDTMFDGYVKIAGRDWESVKQIHSLRAEYKEKVEEYKKKHG